MIAFSLQMTEVSMQQRLLAPLDGEMLGRPKYTPVHINGKNYGMRYDWKCQGLAKQRPKCRNAPAAELYVRMGTPSVHRLCAVCIRQLPRGVPVPMGGW